MTKLELKLTDDEGTVHEHTLTYETKTCASDVMQDVGDWLVDDIGMDS